MELFNADCFDILPELKDNSVNMFLLDLPYNQTACKWDKDIIDLEKMWTEIKRIMKPDGIIVMFCTAKFGYRLIHSNPKWFRYDLIWKKSRKVGFLSANKMPLRQHENIYIFKEKLGTYNPQKVEGKPYVDRRQHKIKNYYRENGKEYEFTPQDNKGMYHPTSVIEHENIYVFKDQQGTYNPQKTKRDKDYKHSGKRSSEEHYGNVIECKKEYKKEDGMHPTSVIEHEKDLENTILEFKNPSKSLHRTQKPVELCEWLIRSYTNEGDVVCDFCMGSGTTGVACVNTKRQFVGVEKEDKIFEVAYNRIHNINTSSSSS